MADIVFAGDALAVAQVRSQTITGYDAATTYKCTINGKVISTVGTGGTVTTTAVALVALLNAATAPPEFREITWSNSSGTVIGTCDTPGKAITFTLTVTGGTGTVGAASNTTSNDGPNAVTANNFKDASSGSRTLPVDSDNLFFYDTAVSLTHNLDAATAVDVAVLHIKASFEGTIGLPFMNEDDDAYQEYRERYFLLNGAANAYIGEGDGDGSERLMLNLQAIQSNVLVAKTATSADDYHALIIKGTNSSNVLKAEGGSVDIAPFAGETATFATLTASNDAIIRTWGGVTLTTVNCDGDSAVTIHSAAALTDITTINVRENATCTLRGDNAVGTINIDGSSATLDLQSSGTVTTLNLYPGATLDVTSNPTGVTVTTINIYGPCTINDPNGKLTVTNAISNWAQVTFNGQPKRAVTLGSP